MATPQRQHLQLADPSKRVKRLHEKFLRASSHVSKPRIGDARKRSSGTIQLGDEDPRLVLCDPYRLSGAPPLDLAFPPEHEWWVELLEVWFEKSWRVGAMFARRVVPLLPGRWEPARFADGATSFGVDYAMAAVASADFAASVARDGALKKRIEDRLAVGGPATQLKLFYADGAGKKHSHTLWWFDSGLGDGRYPAWWGVSANGETCALAVDFGVPLLHRLSDKERAWHEGRGSELEAAPA